MTEVRKHCMRTVGVATMGLNITFKHTVEEPKYFPELPHTYVRYF